MEGRRDISCAPFQLDIQDYFFSAQGSVFDEAMVESPRVKFNQVGGATRRNNHSHKNALFVD